jgi:general secretion pathway protein D
VPGARRSDSSRSRCGAAHPSPTGVAAEALRSTRASALLLAAAVWLAAGVASAQKPPVVVYGIEHEVRNARERVLVMAREKLEPRLEAGAEGDVVLVLPGAVLDDSAPRRVAPKGRARVRAVRAAERFEGPVPEVRITVVRSGGGRPELIQRGAILALEFTGPVARRATGILVQYEATPMRKIVEEIAGALGETWVFDDSLKGTLTVVAPDRVSPEEARSLLHAGLRLTGQAALPLPKGGWRVAPIANAVPLGPWSEGEPATRLDRPVTTLVRLGAASAETLVPKLDPWLGASAVALSVPRSNAIILAGPESQVHVLLTLIRSLDQGADASLWVRRVRNADVEVAAGQLRESFSQAPPGRGIEVWADPRSGLLVARGAPSTLDEARRRLEQIDGRLVGFGVFEVRRLLHADPEDMKSILESLATNGEEGLTAGSFTVAVDNPTNSLVMSADREVQARLAEVIDTLDRPPPRIHVEAMVLEVVASEALSLGVDAFIPFGDPDSSFGGFALLDPSGDGLQEPGTAPVRALGANISRKPLSIPIVGPGGEISTVLVPRESLVITADERIVKTQVLLRPNLLLLSGEEHEIFSGDEVPIPVSSTTPALGVPSTSVNLQRENVGVRLRLRPSLGQGGRVQLETEIESSRVRTAATVASGSQGAVIQTRTISTTVVLEDDETAMIGATVFDDYQELDIGTPWLKDIPALGWLFRRNDRQLMKSHLVVTLQARIQGSPESDLAETIRRRIGMERSMARVKGLERGPEPRWALRVATVERFDDALDVAAHFERLGERTEIVSWSWNERPRHDVLLDGFDSLAQASQAALRARDEGFAAEMVPVPAAAH